MSGFKFVTEFNEDEEKKKKLQQNNAPQFNFVTELNPVPIKQPVHTNLKEEDIFMDAPNNASSFIARKTLNFQPATENIDLTPIDVGELSKQKDYTIDEWNKLGPFAKIKAGIEQKRLGNYDYAPREDLYKQEVNKQANSKLGAGIAGFANAASLGSLEAGAKAQTKDFELPNVFNEAETQSPVSYNVGKIAGYVAPSFLGAGAAKPITNLIANPLSKQVAEGAIVGTAMTGIEDAFQGKSLKETGKDIAVNAALGAGLDVALHGVGKLAGKLTKGTRKSIAPAIEVPETKLQADAPVQGNSEAFTQKPSLGATDRLHSMTQIVASDENKVKPSIKDTWSKLYTRFVDSVSPIKNIGEDTYTLATNSKNTGGVVDHILTENLVDRQGNKIGESFKNIVKDIPENQQSDFANYVLQRHNIDRAREGKHVYSDFTPEESAKAVQLIEKVHPEYKDLNDRLIKFVRDFEAEWGNKSGLISDEVWQNLQDTYKNYVPTQRSFDELEKGFSNANGRGFVDQGNTLKKATGSDRDIINPLENIMQLVNKTVRTAKYNEVGQSMLNEIRKNPSGLQHLAEIIPDTEAINSNVKNIVTVLENGKPVNVRINNKQLLEALQGITKANVGSIEGAVKKGTNVFKALITTKNPVFAVRNMARDIPTAYINGSEANPIKFAGDLFKAGKDVVTNSSNYQKYKAVGGGGSNFLKPDKTAASLRELTGKISPVKKGFKKVNDVIEHVNNIIESAPRLAEFNRILDKTGDINKALFAANDVTTNFSRGGDITKHIDSFVPYLNAGVQGLDKLARQFVDKPIPTAAKGLIGITSATLVLDFINKDNPKYQQLDNRTKDNYFLIPNGDTFIKIPKSREYGVLFSDLFERTLRRSRGEQNPFKGFGNTVATNFSPANPLEANIFSPALGLKSNKDFANRDIVPRVMQEDNRSKYLQFDEKTSEITKWFAKEANKVGLDLSPKQMDYLIKSYTGVIGQLGLPATTKATMTGNTGQKLLKPVTSQFVADPLYSNQNITDFYDNYDKIKTLAADKNINQNIPAKKTTPEEKYKSVFTKASSDMSDLNKKIREAELKNDLETIKKLRYKMIEIALKANNQFENYQK